VLRLTEYCSCHTWYNLYGLIRLTFTMQCKRGRHFELGTLKFCLLSSEKYCRNESNIWWTFVHVKPVHSDYVHHLTICHQYRQAEISLEFIWWNKTFGWKLQLPMSPMNILSPVTLGFYSGRNVPTFRCENCIFNIFILKMAVVCTSEKLDLLF
jgi:hypothetical protein